MQLNLDPPTEAQKPWPTHSAGLYAELLPATTTVAALILILNLIVTAFLVGRKPSPARECDEQPGQRRQPSRSALNTHIYPEGRCGAGRRLACDEIPRLVALCWPILDAGGQSARPRRDTGEGLGASHQTGWTSLVAHLICTRDVL